MRYLVCDLSDLEYFLFKLIQGLMHTIAVFKVKAVLSHWSKSLSLVLLLDHVFQ